MALNGHGRIKGGLWLTRSYNFVDKNPECDVFCALYQKERIKETDLAVLAGLAASTVKNMFGGKTRKPQHATFAKLAGAMGYKNELKRDDTPDYAKEIPKARAQFRDYRELLARRRERGAKKKSNGHAK